MKREFFLNILFLVSINLLIKPFYIFGIDRTVQNVVGIDAYGLYFILFNFTFLLQIINDFGIQIFNSRKIAQNPELIAKYFPGIMLLKLFLGGLFFATVFIAAHFNYNQPSYYPFLWWIGLIHVLNSLILYLRSNIAGLGWYRTDSIISSLNKLLMIIICGVLLWTANFRDDFRIEWFIYAQVATLLITALIAGWIIRKKVSWQRWKIDRSFILQIIKDSYPYALVIFLMTVYTRVDVVMIELLLSDGIPQAGVYASAYRLLDASNMIGFLFAGLLLPMFAKMLKTGESFRELLRFSFQLIMAGSITVSIGVYFFQEEIMFLLYDEATSDWGPVLGYLMLSFIPVCAIYIYSTLLTANENLMQMNRLFVLGIVMNIVLNYFLIQSHKAAGAALTTALTQSFIALGLIVLAMKNFNLIWDNALIAKIVGFTIGVIILFYSSTHLNDVDWTVKFLGSIILSILLAFLFRLIHLRSFMELLETKVKK